jgi:DNA polymerase III epsilon subunit family exonuclease
MNISELKQFHWDSIPNEFVIVDVETTGLDEFSDRILEIGAVHFVKSDYLTSGEVTTFQVFIKQDKPIPSEATAINNITNEMVADGDTEHEALSKFFDFVGKKRLFAYYAKFDKGFIEQAIKRSEYQLQRSTFAITDIYALAKKYVHHLPNRKLETIARSSGYKLEGAHRAVNDCAMALHVFIYLKNVEYAIKKDAAASANLTIKEFEKFNEESNSRIDDELKTSAVIPSKPLTTYYDYPSTHQSDSTNDSIKKNEVKLPIAAIVAVFFGFICLFLVSKQSSIVNCINKAQIPTLSQSQGRFNKEQVNKYEKDTNAFVSTVQLCIH